jgi:hypothetical protein
LSGNVLHTTLDWCLPHTESQVVVNLCIYRQNRNACRVVYDEENILFDPTPFLQFVVEYHASKDKSTDMYTFPFFQYECVEGDNEHHFEEACLLHTIEHLKWEQTDKTVEIEPYRGFVMHNDQIYAVMDYDELAKQFRPSADAVSDPPQLAIVDELVLQKQILGVPVDPQLTAMFEQNEYMWHIESEGESIPIPLCLYPCKLHRDESYDESYSRHPLYENRRVEKRAEGATRLLSNRKIEHPLYGDMFVFSKQPLVPDEPGEEGAPKAPYERCAVFVSEPRMVFDVVDETPGVSLMEKKRQLLTYLDHWNDEQGILPDTSAPYLPLEVEEAPATEPPAEPSAETDAPVSVPVPPTDEDSDPPMDDQEVENELDEEFLMIPSIFFKLSSADTQGAWGVKYAKQFTSY